MSKKQGDSPIKKTRAPRPKKPKVETPKMEIKVAEPALYTAPPKEAEVVDPNNVMMTNMLEMQKMMMEMVQQNKILMEQNAELAKNSGKPVPQQSNAEEAEEKNIYAPLRRKITYRLYHIKYDAEGNKVFDNPMYDYEEFDTMQDLLNYADEKNLGREGHMWQWVPYGNPMPDDYWKEQDALDK